MSVRLLVGTPTTNGFVLSDHASALVALSRRLDAARLDWCYRSIDGPNAGIQRDWLARHCLADDHTHLLLLDGDVIFPPDLAERLLARARPVVGAVYARGAPDLGRMASLIPRHGFDDAFALCHDWALEPLGPAISVENGLMAVAALGTGALLIERGCLETLAASGRIATYSLLHPEDRLRAFFRDLHEADAAWDGDYAFSRRWRAAGGEILVDVTAAVRRIGTMRFGLPFSAFLEALRSSAGEAALAPVTVA